MNRIIGVNHTKTFTLHKSTSKELDKSYEKYKRAHPDEYHTLSKHANRMIKNALAIEFIQSKVAAAYTVILNQTSSKLHVEDNETNRVYRVVKEDGHLLCMEDKSHNCKHCMACYISPKTAALFKDGFEEMVDLPTH